MAKRYEELTFSDDFMFCKWRLEYVTLLERDEKMKEQGREEGRAEGRAEERKNMLLEAKRADEAEQRAEAAKQDAETKRQETLAVSIVNLMNNLRITMDQAMDALGIPASERNGYASLVDELSEEASPSTNFTRSRKDWPRS